MYVILEEVASVALPYTLDNGAKRFFTFMPGKNEIDADVWRRVQKANAKAFELQPPEMIHPFESHLKTGGKANLFEYDQEEMLEIVVNARCRDFLQTLLSFELARRDDQLPRPTVIAAIEGKLSQKEWTMDELNELGEHYKNYADLLSPAEQEKLDRIYRTQLNKS